MKNLLQASVLILAVGLAPAAFADEVTLGGSVMCGKCVRGETAECQDVLVVAAGDDEGQYWIVKNAVSEGFGHTCEGEKPVQVTGSVAEKDGQKWITPTEMKAPAY